MQSRLLTRRPTRCLTPPQSLFSKVRKNVPTETIPIVTIVTGAVMGAGYYLYRLSQGSEVVWNRHGDQRPWDKIQQHENTKFVSIRCAQQLHHELCRSMETDAHSFLTTPTSGPSARRRPPPSGLLPLPKRRARLDEEPAHGTNLCLLSL